MQVGRGRNLHAHPSVRTSRVCRNPKSDNAAHLHQHKPKTLARGQASRGGRCGASSGTASSGWLTRRRRDQGGVPHEVPVTQAMTTEGARRVPARRCPPSRSPPGLGLVAPKWQPLPDASVLRACACCRRSGNGGPQTCLPAAYGVAQRGAHHGPSSPTQTQDPREWPSLAGRTMRSFLRHGLIRLAHEGAERSRWGTS